MVLLYKAKFSKPKKRKNGDPCKQSCNWIWI